MDMQAVIKLLAAGTDLSLEQMQAVMGIIMRGQATPAQIGAFLVALSIKGESVTELVGAATTMRQFAAPVAVAADKVVECVGTGGDGASLFNVSTASAIVTAAAGATVAKHGNRAATGKSGSADVLAAAGVNIALSPAEVAQCIAKVGIGFMFAPTHHAATKHVIEPRREIGVRSIFNLLGPLTNPANARYQLVGVYAAHWVKPIALVFGQLGSVHTLVVHSKDGLDEISLAAPTTVTELKQGKFYDYEITPEQFGIKRAPLDPLVVEDADHSLRLMREALGGVKGPAFDIVALNAGATIYAGDISTSLQGGVERAIEIMRSGKALEVLENLKATSNALGV